MTMDAATVFTYKDHIKPNKIHEGYCPVCRRWTGTDELGRLRPHGPGVEAWMCVAAGRIAASTRSMYPKSQPRSQ